MLCFTHSEQFYFGTILLYKHSSTVSGIKIGLEIKIKFSSLFFNLVHQVAEPYPVLCSAFVLVSLVKEEFMNLQIEVHVTHISLGHCLAMETARSSCTGPEIRHLC